MCSSIAGNAAAPAVPKPAAPRKKPAGKVRMVMIIKMHHVLYDDL